MLLLASILLFLSIAIHLIDFFRVNDVAERVLKIDLISLNTIGIFTILAIERGVESYLEIALLWALFAFVGTAVFASTIRRTSE